jgi:zinc transport system substrate-binding protein
MRRGLWAVLLATVAAACQEAPAPAGKPLVVASFYPMYEFSRQVAGDRAEVVSLVPPGVEPHDWEPSPQKLVEVQNARLLVYNGAGFEPWVDRLLQDVTGRKLIVIETTRGLDLIPAPGTGAAGSAPTAAGMDARKTRNGAGDPHVWLDPVLAQSQVEAIRAGLAQGDPANTAAYDEHARAFRARLGALDAAFQAGLRDCEHRDIVVSHASFAYLARRYGLTQVALMGLAPESEPSPAELAAIANLARRRKVTSIFFETLVSSRLAETLAREIGAKTLVLNPIEGLTKEEAAAGKGYVDLMEANLQSLRTGLGCR